MIVLQDIGFSTTYICCLIHGTTLILFLCTMCGLCGSRDSGRSELHTLPVTSLFLIVPFTTSITRALSGCTCVGANDVVIPCTLNTKFFVTTTFILVVVYGVCNNGGTTLVYSFTVVSFTIGFTEGIYSIVVLTSCNCRVDGSCCY